MYYLFLDESGDHNYTNLSKAPVFVLTGCIFNNSSKYLNYLDAVTKMHKLKENFFNNFYTIFHTRDITRNVRSFKKVGNKNFRDSFFKACNKLIKETNFLIISSIINKLDLFNKYGLSATDPYHYSFDRIIERFVLFLEQAPDEKKGIIFYESRRPDLDKKLEQRYKSIIENGTITISGYINMKASRINSRIINLIKLNKDSNIAGIQYSDLCATPISRKERGLNDNFIEYKIMENKFRRSPKGKVKGWGVIRIN